MLSRLKARLTYANVMATLAMFVALGGSAYAVNNFTGADIQDESLTGADIKGVNGTQTSKGTNGSITSADISGQPAIPAVGQQAVNGSINTYDIADGWVRGVDLQANTLTGAQINESTLGTVPSAHSADVASSLAVPEGWHYIGDLGEPQFANGWHNYDPATDHTSATYPQVAYMRDKEGVVHIQGLAAGGEVGQPMFRLPANYRPWFYHAFPGVSNNAFARLTVQAATGPDWTCGVYAETGSNVWVSLDGVRYEYAPLEERSAASAPR